MIKKIFSLIVLFILIFLLSNVSLAEMPPAPPSDDNTTGNDYTTYNSPDLNFSVDYPQDWYTDEKNCSLEECDPNIAWDLDVAGVSIFSTFDLSSTFNAASGEPYVYVLIMTLNRRGEFSINDNGIVKTDGTFYDMSIGSTGIVEEFPLSVIQGNDWKGIERGFRSDNGGYLEVRTFLETSSLSNHIYYIQYLAMHQDNLEKQKTIYRNMVNSLVITPSSIEADLLRASNGYKVYEIKEGQRHWIPTAEIFNHYHFNWQGIQVVSESNLTSYPRTKLLRATGDPKVYYLTESGMIRHIPNATVFESYGNKWEDILEIDPVELEVYESNHLIRQTGDYKVYHLENNLKHWIKSPAVFNKRGYDWNKIAPVNQAELETYSTGFPLE